jgi:CDP-glucose 4,6-dehydratase
MDLRPGKVENLGIDPGYMMFNAAYHDKRVLITGHTGFKGSWLALLLTRMGAKITGYSLQPPTSPSHFQLLGLNINSVIGDVRDGDKLKEIFIEQKPEIVFHLAAQAIVRLSYKDPVETFSSNVMGTVNVLEAARAGGCVSAIVNVTSDKCYENREWPWGYRETDALGGYDPYSASKGCAEMITTSYRNSFFNLKEYGRTHRTLVASARAGNVIGGGDWATDRLIPDIMRSVSQNEIVKIRNPYAVRPWQHVLEPLHGYLLLGQRLLEGRKEFSDAWNFGPSEEDSISVGEIVTSLKKAWPKIDYEISQIQNQPHEAGLLRLDCSKARNTLKWKPVWTGQTAVEKTAQWYRTFYESGRIQSYEDIENYLADARGAKNEIH